MLFEGVLLFTILVVYFILDEIIKSKNLPPGPFPLPIIGNIHLLSSKTYLDLYRLAFRYGPVYRLRLGSNRVVVINGYSSARDAMVKKGLEFVGKLFSRDGKSVGFQGYTKQLKLQRSAIIQTMRRFERDGRMEEIVTEEIEHLICKIEEYNDNTMAPETFRENITEAQSHIIASLTFGESFSKDKDSLSEITNFLGVFSKSLSANNIIDAFPFMKYFPFSIINKLRKACLIRDKIFDERFKIHKQVINNDFSKTKVLVDNLLQMREKSHGNPEHNPAEDLTDDHVIMTINDAFIAGSEGPSSNFIWIIYFLVKFPDMQARIQKELDEVLGNYRAPKWCDRQIFPYLEAFINECMRIASVMPLALPHQTTADTTIGSYQIPQNTTVILNMYAIHRDPETWEKPDEFKPERFLNQDGTLNPDMSSKIIAYGIGQRACPGEALARMEIFLFTTKLLQKFTFGYHGYDLPDVHDGEFGLVNRSPDINITITKRQ